MNERVQYEEMLRTAEAENDQFKIQFAKSKLAELEGSKEAHEARVQESLSEFDVILQQMDFGGLTLKQIIGGENEYQLVTIELKKYFIAQAERFSKQISELHTTYGEQLREAGEREGELRKELAETNEAFGNERLKSADLEQKRNAAAEQLQEAQDKIKQLEGWNADLHRQIANGVREELKVIDTEAEELEKKKRADQFRRERTIYGKEALDFRRSRFKAYLAATGEEVTFTNLEEPKYIELKPKNENENLEELVQQFRQQYGVTVEANGNADLALDKPADTIEKLKEPSFPGEEQAGATAGAVEAAPMAERAPSEDGEGAEAEGEVTEIEARFRRIEEHLGLKSWRFEQ